MTTSIPDVNQQPTSWWYSVRCGLTTASRLAMSVFFSSQAAPYLNPDKQKAVVTLKQSGYQFTAHALNVLLKEIFEEFKKELSVAYVGGWETLGQLATFPRYLAIPMIVDGTLGNHITLLFLEKINHDVVDVEFFDGKAHSIEDPKNSQAKAVFNRLKGCFIVRNFLESNKPLQFDGHNCGAFICWFIENRLKGNPFQTIQSLEPNIERYRMQLADRLTLHSEEGWKIVDQKPIVESETN
jgi:hypothetical protein